MGKFKKNEENKVTHKTIPLKVNPPESELPWWKFVLSKCFLFVLVSVVCGATSDCTAACQAMALLQKRFLIWRVTFSCLIKCYIKRNKCAEDDNKGIVCVGNAHSDVTKNTSDLSKIQFKNFEEFFFKSF